jgi:hypothetical protein
LRKALAERKQAFRDSATRRTEEEEEEEEDEDTLEPKSLKFSIHASVRDRGPQYRATAITFSVLFTKSTLGDHLLRARLSGRIPFRNQKYSGTTGLSRNKNDIPEYKLFQIFQIVLESLSYQRIALI